MVIVTAKVVDNPAHIELFEGLTVIIGRVLSTIATLSVIVRAQAVMLLVARTVYEPIDVLSPKSRAKPVPETGDPLSTPPIFNW